MSFSSYNPNDRYRRRSASRFGSFLLASFILLLAGVIGFWIGYSRAGSDERVLRKDLAELRVDNTSLETALVDARSEAQTASMRYEQLQGEYQDKIPNEDVEELVDLLTKQIKEGRSAERLAFLIRSARPPRNCTAINTKRFVVATAANEGPASRISIADGAVLITGKGVSARNSAGKPEAWFDPTRSVSLEFATRGGESEAKKGVFPIHHSVVADDREYRFTISDGARSFAKVTYDSCDYP